MALNYKLLDQKDFEEAFGEKESFALDVLLGLSESQKRISSKYLYDKAGSQLFRQIMDIHEYYPTDCEFEIFNTHKQAFADMQDEDPFNLIELGAGDGRKTFVLLEHFLANKLDFEYHPIDISESAMKELTLAAKKKFPGLQGQGIVSEYFNGIKWLTQMNKRRNLVLFLGSNIGNFNRASARVFLHNLWNSLNDGDCLLIGFDLKKEIDILLKAYNDPEGITAKFNLNLLVRINRELNADFNLNDFRHYATYDVLSGAMESYLVSLKRQTVFIGAINKSFEFEPWEPIHTEYSYKYLKTDIEGLAADTGFTIEKNLQDKRGYFLDSIWRVEKQA